MLCELRKRRRRDFGFRVESISPALNWTCLWKDFGFRVESISPALDMSLEGFCFPNSAVKALTARAQCLSWILHDFVVGLILFEWMQLMELGGFPKDLGHMAEM